MSEPVRWWVAAPVAALVLALAPVPAWVVDEFYSRDMYPWLQTWMTMASNVLPLAVLDVLLAGVLVLVLVRIGRLWHVARQRGWLDAAGEAVRRTIRFVAVVVILFLWTWGCQYRRLPLEASLPGGTAATPTEADLRVAVSEANALAARLRPGLADVDQSYDALALQLREPMNRALEALDLPDLGTPGRPKYSLLLTPYFTMAGINGMIDPFALEAIVHPDLLPFERAFVLAHEWGHLAGQADEAEASAVGWLACLHGPPAAAYSASLYLIVEAGAGMSREARREAVAALDPGVRRDLEAITERLRKQHPQVQRVAVRAYDEFLRANRVEDGTQSYARALTLILSPKVYAAMGAYTPSR